MSWQKVTGANIPKSGAFRHAAMYSKLAERGEWIEANYNPCIGGISAGSYITVGASTTSTLAYPIITPAKGTMDFVITAQNTGAGSGAVIVTTAAGDEHVNITSTSPATYTVTGLGIAGTSAERVHVEVANTAGSGSVQAWAGFFRHSTADGSELDAKTPDSAALATEQGITAEQIKRLRDAAIYTARRRPPALSFFTYKSRASGSNSFNFNRDLFVPSSYRNALGKKPHHKLILAFTAATTVRAEFLYADLTQSQNGAGTSTVAYLTSSSWQPYYFRFVYNGTGGTTEGDYAPIDSYVLYEGGW